MKDIHERVFEFACRIVRLHDWYCRRRRGSRTLVNQLLDSGRGIGSNLEEARAGQSRAGFIATAPVALSEAREPHYCPRLTQQCGHGPPPCIHPLLTESKEVLATL